MKKLWQILIAVIMVFSLAACSSNRANPAPSQSNNSGNTEKQNVSEGVEKKDDSTPAKIRIVRKDDLSTDPVTVDFYDRLEKMLAEKADIHVNFEIVDMPQGDYAEKLNLMLFGGEIPDMIYFQGGDQQIAQQGLLEDLRPYIEKSKYLKNALESHTLERIENYPYLLHAKPISPKAPVIRQDWLEKASSGKALLDNPTVDNYLAFFRELIASPPGGADKPKYAITTSGTLAELDFIFDMAFGNNQTWLKQADGTYKYNRVSETEKNKLAFYHQLYEEGLLDPQYITKKWDTKEKSFYDNESAIIVGTVGAVVDIYNSKMTQVHGDGASLAVLPAAKGEYQGFGATDVTKESRGMAISSQSPHKEIVFEIFDFLASPEGQQFTRLGYEGEHYNVKDGKIELTEKYYAEWQTRFWEPTEFETSHPLGTPLHSEPGLKSLEMANAYFVGDNNFLPLEEHIPLWDAMNNLYVEFATDVVTGKRSIDQFDTFVSEWNKAGGEMITKYANEILK